MLRYSVQALVLRHEKYCKDTDNNIISTKISHTAQIMQLEYLLGPAMEGYNAKKDTSLKFTLKLSPHDPNCPLTGRSKLSRAVYTSVLRLRFRMSLGQFRSVFYVCSIK